VHKFTFSVYPFSISSLSGELWFFEVHWEVHKFTKTAVSSFEFQVSDDLAAGSTLEHIVKALGREYLRD
jgi:hypothetical protein